MRKRNVEIKFRLTEKEYAVLSEKVKQSGLNRNAFLVRMIHSQTIYPIEPLQVLNQKADDCLTQLRGIATNINQMAKIANTYRALPELSSLQNAARLVWETQKLIQPVFSLLREILYGNR